MLRRVAGRLEVAAFEMLLAGRPIGIAYPKMNRAVFT